MVERRARQAISATVASRKKVEMIIRERERERMVKLVSQTQICRQSQLL